MDKTFTPDLDFESTSERVLEFIALLPNDFYDYFGIAPKNETVSALKKMAREVALNG